MRHKPRIGWVIDYPLKGSGGHKTFFYYINPLVERGFDVDVYVNSSLGTDSEKLREIIGEYLIPTKANIIPGWNIRGEYDVLFATFFKNARIVAEYPHANTKIFFEQDFGPYFNPMGYEYLEAENAYRYGMKAITMGKWLANKLITDFNVQAEALFLGADRNIYYDQEKHRTNEVCFIFQPEKPRRGQRLIRETIDILYKTDPGIKAVTYGSEVNPGIVYAEHRGLLPMGQLAKMYNTCKVGVSFSSSNPSRIPFEMMASGLPVVELYRDNNLYDLSDKGTVLASPDPMAFASAIVDIVHSEHKWARLHTGGLEFMKKMSIDDSVGEFMKILDKALQGKRFTKSLNSKIYNSDTVEADPVIKQKFMFAERSLSYQDGEENSKYTRGSFGKLIRRRINTIKRKKSVIAKKMKAARIRFRIGGGGFKYKMKRVPLYFRKYQLLTSDIFDTLLRRVVDPEEVKFKTALLFFLKYNRYLEGYSVWDVYNERQRSEHRLGKRAENTGKDFEYELSDVLEDMTTTFLGRVKDVDIKSAASELTDLEKEQEASVIYPDPVGVKLFRKIKAEVKVLLSDFYIRSRELAKILPLKDLVGDYDDIYVSVDNKVNKISGKSFGLVEKQHGISPENHLHIGDNPDADIASARAAGVSALHFVNQREERKRLSRRQKWDQRQSRVFPYERDINHLIGQIPIPKDLTGEQTELFRFGTKNALIFYFFVQSVIEQGLKEGADTVYYFAREGYFCKKIHELILENNPFGIDLPQAELLEVSRRATFAPSITNFSVRELMRVWNQYRWQSAKSFFKTLGMDCSEFRYHLDRYEIDPDEEVQIWRNPNFKKLFKDQRFLTDIDKALVKKRKLFLRYLKTKNIELRSKCTYVMSDIGWRGTIQDNLGRLLKNSKLVGIYLGLKRPLNNQPVNVGKIAYGPFFLNDVNNYTHMLEGGATFIEMLMGYPVGSTRGYKTKNRKVVADKEELNEREQQTYDNYVKYFQQGVLTGSKVLADFVGVHGISSSEARDLSLRRLESLVRKPPYILTKVFFGTSYSETFGVGEYFDMAERSTLHKKSLLLTPFSKTKRKEFIEATKRAQWKNGFWKYNDRTGVLNFIMNYYFRYKYFIKKAVSPKRTLKAAGRSLRGVVAKGKKKLVQRIPT
ncbi:MAG: HAD family hydrolase [Candidatus Dojkabacteria bacterium]